MMHIKADDLSKGMVIIERSERGRISRRIQVAGCGPCGDKHNIHVIPEEGGTILCYFRGDAVEISL